MSRKQQQRLIQNQLRDDLKQENARLIKQVEQLTTANTLLKADADKAERYRQEAVRREVDNEYLEARVNTLRTELAKLQGIMQQKESANRSLTDTVAHLREGLQNKMRYSMTVRDQLVKAALNLKVLPEHADTHMECYSDSDLITALVKGLMSYRDHARLWEHSYRDLWAAFEKTCRHLGVLKSVASDVYDLCFGEDRDPNVRRLRRVLKITGAIITRVEETPEDAKKLS